MIDAAPHIGHSASLTLDVMRRAPGTKTEAWGRGCSIQAPYARSAAPQTSQDKKHDAICGICVDRSLKSLKVTKIKSKTAHGT
jgi:hypothetical protein